MGWEFIMSKCTTPGGRRRKGSSIWKSGKTRACWSIEGIWWQSNHSSFKRDISYLKISASFADICSGLGLYSKLKINMVLYKPNISPLNRTGTKRLPNCMSINPLVVELWGLLEESQDWKGSGKEGVWISDSLPVVSKFFNILITSSANTRTDWPNTALTIYAY